MSESAPSTRDKILIAAATMLTKDPTARLSVRAVAARAGVSAGSLRHFFPTQRALIDTVVAGLHTLDLPDNPMDTANSPSERLAACLHLLLAEVGAGEAARQYLHTLHRAYVASPPDEDSMHTYAALERLAVHRVERWLATLRDEGALVTADLEHQARFLLTVVNGLALERALPGAPARLAYEASTLEIAVSSLMTTAGGDSAPSSA
ncbi:TetR/AcrR family transcriptional regulator [Aeromicrobium sp. CF3.5]|uniref:TetR/AcrR family transcriptional regulator n=1 Tax=Aeromicrobium sp. CF3.5 TaxID=3373078 RepID=UPI003EE484FE